MVSQPPHREGVREIPTRAERGCVPARILNSLLQSMVGYWKRSVKPLEGELQLVVEWSRGDNPVQRNLKSPIHWLSRSAKAITGQNSSD